MSKFRYPLSPTNPDGPQAEVIVPDELDEYYRTLPGHVGIIDPGVAADLKGADLENALAQAGVHVPSHAKADVKREALVDATAGTDNPTEEK